MGKMNEVNMILTEIQEALEELRKLGMDVSNLEKEVYELSIPEAIDPEDKLFLRTLNDPTLPQGKSNTYGVFINTHQEEPTLYISLNSKNDENLDINHNELNIWNIEMGSIFVTKL